MPCHRRLLLPIVIALGLVAHRLPAHPQGEIVSEGLAAIRAAAWHDASYRGEGTVVAVWDTGFSGIAELLGTELPPPDRVTVLGIGVEPSGEPTDPAGGRHGTAVAEIIHDIAPAAHLCLLATPMDPPLGEVGAALLGFEPDVVVVSLYGGIACGGDGESAYEELLRELWDAGVLVVAAAGNEGESSWYGPFRDPNGDGIHDFRDYDDTLSFPVFAGDILELRLHWDDPCRRSANRYDLLLYRGEELVAIGSADGGASIPVRRISLAGLPTGTYSVRIRKAPDAEPVPLHLRWINGRRIEYATPYGSIGAVLPACSPFVLTVGAVNWHTGWLETYSSRGPSHQGLLKPELVAPDHVQTQTTGATLEISGAFIGGFEGSSAAAPHVAGAALLVKQAFPAFGPAELRDYLMEHAIDRGVPGADMEFGAGIVCLPPPPQP